MADTLSHCSWLEQEHVKQLILGWRLYAQMRDDGSVFIRGGHGWALVQNVESFASGIEMGIEVILTIPRDFSAAN